jgi:hypothetical protein
MTSERSERLPSRGALPACRSRNERGIERDRRYGAAEMTSEESSAMTVGMERRQDATA